MAHLRGLDQRTRLECPDLAGGMLLPAGAMSAPVDDIAFSRVTGVCLGLGVDGMFTNNPDLLDGVLGDAALSGEAAAQQAAEAYRVCSAGL